MALWIIGYGVVQSIAPRFSRYARVSVFHQATAFSALLTLTTALLIAVWLLFATTQSVQNIVLVVGLLCFGAVFAVNSSLHSYLVVKLADRDAVSLDVGFYYMANAMGRLIGTVLSGWLYQQSGLLACLVSALLMQIATWWVTRKIA